MHLRGLIGVIGLIGLIFLNQLINQSTNQLFFHTGNNNPLHKDALGEDE
jgi:hypothetical protein